MARIKQRVEINGSEYWVTGQNLQSVTDKVVALVTQQAIEKQAEEKKPKVPTFKQYTEKWLHLFVEQKVKPTTLAGYKTYCKIHLYPAFGDTPLDEITLDAIQQFLNDRSRYAAKTLKDIKVFLSMALDAAVDDGYITKNPAASKRIVIPSCIVHERQALKSEELHDIISHLDDLEPRDQMLAALLLFTGMRRGEVLGLRHCDIDIESGFIHIMQTAVYPHVNQAVISTPKTKKSKRSIPILPQLLPYLPSIHDERFVIGEGDKPLWLQQYKNTFTRINKCIDLHNATAHVLRHSLLTLASNSGVEPKMIQALAGHSNVAFTLNQYVHAQESQLTKTAGKISAAIAAM